MTIMLQKDDKAMEDISPSPVWYEPPSVHYACGCENCHEEGLHDANPTEWEYMCEDCANLVLEETE